MDKFDKIQEIIRQTKLPNDFKWYTIGSKSLFEIRGTKNAASTACIAYLISQGFYKYGIKFTMKNSLSTVKYKITRAITTFEQKLKETRAKSFDPDGGSLGLQG